MFCSVWIPINEAGDLINESLYFLQLPRCRLLNIGRFISLQVSYLGISVYQESLDFSPILALVGWGSYNPISNLVGH